MKNYLSDIGFYKVLEIRKSSDTQFSADIALDPDHFIYASHFPGFPVTPGMCICQIATELIRTVFNEEYSLVEGKNIKFIGLLDPQKVDIVQFEFQCSFQDQGRLAAQISVKDNASLFSKLSMIYTSRHA